MDPVIQNAIRRRSELRNELRDIERFLELYQEFKEKRDPRQIAMDVAEPTADSIEQTESASPISSTTSSTDEAAETEAEVPGLSREELRPHIRDVIVTAGKPLTRGQILKRLDTKEVRVGGKYDRSKNMGTILWRLRDDFVNLQGLGYWPRNLPFAEAAYDPEDLNSPEVIDHTLRRTEPEGET